jgi:glycine dehydrogenase subunit 1
MFVANASMYDGGSALAEAALLACGFTRRSKIAVSSTCHPNYIDIIRTYCYGRGIDVSIIPWDNGVVDMEKLSESVDEATAALIVQHPNFFGCLEDMPALSELSHRAGALFITSNDPISLSVLQPPGEYGADIATGEGQALGTPLSLGGPYLGIFAATEQLMRRIPGRIVGRTEDLRGRQGFVLTLQTREQHIRREKATSNICTNNGLNALAATVYMALLGKHGMRKIANLCLQKAGYFANKIKGLDGFSLKFSGPFFKEFVVQCDRPVDALISGLAEKGYFAGIPLARYGKSLENCFLTCVTEKRTKAEIDRLVDLLAEQK